MKAERPHRVLHGNVTHGDTLLKQAVKELGARALDGRTALAKELAEERRELIQALGGLTEVSPQELAIIEIIAQKRVRRKPAATWALLNRDRLVDRRKKTMVPLALQLDQMEDAEVRLLKELGLKRRAKQVRSLQDYLAEKATTADSMSSPDKGPDPVLADGQPASTLTKEDHHHE